MTRRVFSREFRRQAVHLVTQRGVSVAQAARDLDLRATVISRWIREFGDRPTRAFPGKSQMSAGDEEARRLRREVVKLKAERDILEKGAAYFARDHF